MESTQLKWSWREHLQVMSHLFRERTLKTKRRRELWDINGSVYSVQSPARVFVFMLCHKGFCCKKESIFFLEIKFWQSRRRNFLVFLQFNLICLCAKYLRQHLVCVDKKWSWAWIHKKFESENRFLKGIDFFSYSRNMPRKSCWKLSMLAAIKWVKMKVYVYNAKYSSKQLNLWERMVLVWYTLCDQYLCL